MEVKTKTLRGNVSHMFGVDGRDGKSAYEIALENGFEGTETEWLESLKGAKGEAGADGFSEYDYIITTDEDFTTENLESKKGRVLVKGVYRPASEVGFNWLKVTIPSSITEIDFIDSVIFANLTAEGHTKIKGFVSDVYVSYTDAGWSQLKGFKGVENCSKDLILENCTDVIHCSIRQATNCINITDTTVYSNYGDGDITPFYRCEMLSNIRFCSNNTFSGVSDPENYYIEFVECKHLSNIHNLSPEFSKLSYKDCLGVVGDSCDDYYTAEEANNIQLITTDGSKKTIPLSNYEEGHSIPTKNAYGQIELSDNEPLSPIEAVPKWYVDDAIGNIGTILTALHEGGIE